MTFSPSGVLRIDAPPGTGRADIEATVRAHARWISYRLTRAEHEEGYRTPGLVAGAAHRYLGKLYHLEFVDAAGEVLRVRDVPPVVFSEACTDINAVISR